MSAVVCDHQSKTEEEDDDEA